MMFQLVAPSLQTHHWYLTGLQELVGGICSVMRIFNIHLTPSYTRRSSPKAPDCLHRILAKKIFSFKFYLLQTRQWLVAYSALGALV